MLYHRDERTGDHLVSHQGQERRYPTRAEALCAARDLLADLAQQSDRGDAERRARWPRLLLGE